jgi:hypothetical protein
MTAEAIAFGICAAVSYLLGRWDQRRKLRAVLGQVWIECLGDFENEPRDEYALAYENGAMCALTDVQQRMGLPTPKLKAPASAAWGDES